MKRIAFIIVCLLFKTQLIAQTQYDYYDDGAVAGGADRALNGIIIIGGIIVVAIVLVFVLGGAAKIYYWFNPTADPEYKRMLVEKEKEAKRAKEKEAGEKKQAVLGKEKNRKKDAVDLGLSVLWADSNLFAESVSDSGAKFSWGDRKKKTVFRYGDSYLNEKWEPDLKGILGNDDLSICGNEIFDAAAFLWGKEWRLPQKYEIEELIEKCEWQWTLLNGMHGYKVIGQNGNSIFLPVTGEIVLDENRSTQSGYYWSGIASSNHNEAKYLYFDTNIKETKDNGQRWHGMAIRPVWSPRKKTIEEILKIVESNEDIIKTTDSSLYTKYRNTFALTEKPRTNDIMRDLELRKMYSDDGQKLISTHNGAGGWGKGQININPKPGTKIICDDAYDDYDNRFVEEIIIPDSVVAIGYNAFMSLGVDNLIIPASVRYITGNPFGRLFGHYKKACCDSKYFKMTNGVLYSSDKLLYVANIESEARIKHIPDGFKIIGRGAINGHDELELLRVPSSVLAIAEGAISECKNLSVIVFEGEVAVIEPTAIDKNENIKVLFVPKGLINYYQNHLSEKLKELVRELPDSNETDDEILNSIIVNEDIQRLNNSTTELVEKNTISSSDLEFINQIKKDYKITAVAPEDWDDKVIDWGEHENEEHDCWDRGEASYSKDGKRFLIFEDNLAEYRIRDGVEILCDNAFTNGCDDKRIILPKTVTTIGNFVFWHTYLEEFVIPNSVIKITGNPFVKCEVNLKCNASCFCLDGKVLYDKEKKRIVSVIDDIERTVQNKPVQIAPTVKIIGRNSFYEISCGPVALPNSVLYIGDAAFKYSIISDISLGENLYEIGEAAFAHSFISSMNIPDSVEIIGKSAFEYCDRLETIKLSANLTVIEAETFTHCNYLNEIYIPTGVKIIKRGAFSWCKSLTRIFLPNSIEKIEKEAFVYCGFKTVIIPKHTIVEEGAFTNDCKVIRRD